MDIFFTIIIVVVVLFLVIGTISKITEHIGRQQV